MAQRIRGQDVEVYFVGGNVTIPPLTDIRSFDITPKFHKLEEEYLGETNKRYDELFDGVDFNMEMHIEDAGVVDFISLIRQRAVDRTSKTKIYINANLKFASGSTKRIVLNDCFFENVPLTIGGRSDYVSFKISGSCSDFEVF